MATTCTVRIEFSAAKRLMDFRGPCNFVHGYHHIAEATLAPVGKGGNIVMDFAEIEKLLSGWIARNWAHTLILNKRDKKLGAQVEAATGQKVFYTEQDPSAEYLAEYLGHTIAPKLFKAHKVKCVSLKLYDHANAWVEWVA